MKKMSIGDMNTGDELAHYLIELTGFTQFNCISGGQKVELFGNGAPLRDLRIGNGLLMVRKVADTPEKQFDGRSRVPSPIDSKVIAHFNEGANLPNFELPPPSNLQFTNNGSQRFHQLPNLNGMQSNSASVSLGNLLTPPSNSASDNASPVSSSMNNSNTPSNQRILTYTPTWWATGTTPSGFHTGFTPQHYPRGGA
jgi:hypothetical protein